MTMPECNSQGCANEGGPRNTETKKHNLGLTSDSISASTDSSDCISSSTTSAAAATARTRDSASASCADSGSAAETKNPQGTTLLGEYYWRAQYESLLVDYNRLQKLNDKLEDKLLNIVDECERDKQECVANVEYEKSTLMADVNKLSTKLVHARIKLHDYEEKELIHAAECSSPCHKGLSKDKYAGSTLSSKDHAAHDPNLV